MLAASCSWSPSWRYRVARNGPSTTRASPARSASTTSTEKHKRTRIPQCRTPCRTGSCSRAMQSRFGLARVCAIAFEYGFESTGDGWIVSLAICRLSLHIYLTFISFNHRMYTIHVRACVCVRVCVCVCVLVQCRRLGHTRIRGLHTLSLPFLLCPLATAPPSRARCRRSSGIGDPEQSEYEYCD